MGHVVTAPLIQARKEDGSFVHLYEGMSLPDDIDGEQLKQLLDSKMVAASADGGAAADGGDSDSLPKASASKGNWVDYAVSEGLDREGVESLTKDGIRDLFAADASDDSLTAWRSYAVSQGMTEDDVADKDRDGIRATLLGE